MIDALATSIVVRAIGWALVQSLWQGAVVGVVTAAALLALRRSAASHRYAVACVGLAAMSVVAIATAAARMDERRPALIQSIRTARSAPDRADGVTRDAVGAASRLGTTSAPRRSIASHPPWSPERLEPWSVIAVPIWLAGVLLLSVRLVSGWVVVERIRRAAVRPIAETWRSSCDTMACRLRVTRPVRIVESAAVVVPMVIGWFRPVILLPGSVLTGLSPSQLEAVIAHELAHVQRHDYLVNIVQTAVETLFFYHPAVWWISRQIRREREHCCDDVAVALCGDPATYAGALADLEELRRADGPFALAVSGGTLMHRVRRLLGSSSAPADQPSAWVVVCSVAVLSLILMGRDVKSAKAGADDGGIKGRVVDARSGRPLPSATVELSNGGRVVIASTDTDGRYETRGLQEGEWHAYVQAAGYVPAQYGQRNASENGTGIEVRSGQVTSITDVGLQPAGVLSGRVFSDVGKGLSGVQVELLAERYLPEGPAPMPVAFAQTEELGQFRFGDLMPGLYFVRAYLNRPVAPSRRGTGVYTSTYFPGATRIDEAQQMLISAGQELLDVDFRLATVKTRVVSGAITDPTGASIDQAKVFLMAVENNTGTFSQTALVSADGAFQFRAVVPGDYMLSVLDGVRTMRWMAATRLVRVDESDVSDVVLVAKRGAQLEGRVVRDGGGPLPFDGRLIGISFQQRVPTRPGRADWIQGFGAGAEAFAPDGSFSIESPGGPSTVQLLRLPLNWTIEAIRVDGSDIADRALDFGEGGPIKRLDIVLTDRISDVDGMVTDRNNRVVTNCTIVVFTEDRERWKAPSRLVRAARPRQSGRYQIESLPPADYLAIAVEALPRNAWNDPTVLDRLWPFATRFSLREGEQRVVDLKLSRTPDGLLPER